MGDVVELRVPRKDPEPGTRDERRFYCLHCEWQLFALNTRGEVKCGNCGALIDNLRVSEGR